MKSIKLVLAIASVFVFASCSYQLYPTKDMAFNYDMRMNTEEELSAKAKVKIFLNESDVKGEYKVLSYLTYKPFTIPIFMSHKGQVKKKFYEKSVMKAYELGGNGIIIMSGGDCKIIDIVNWDSDAEGSATFVNVIFDRTLMDKFINGEVSKEGKKEKKQSETAFKTEIENNIKYAKTLEEVAFIREKIDVYQKYNSSLEKPSSSINKTVTVLQEALNVMEKKIKIKLQREAKKAEKGKSATK